MVPVDYNDMALVYTAFISFILLIFSFKIVVKLVFKGGKIG